MSLTIVFWLWHDVPAQRWGHFTADHVNRAAAMVRANVRIAHEIACITDDPSGIDSSIRIIPLWSELADLGRCWRRLKAFSPEMADVIGPRFVWLDLDLVVTGDLTPLLDRSEDIVLWRSQTTRCPFNGSVLMMTAGARPQVWDDFRPGVGFSPRWPGSDQAWIAHVLGEREATWTHEDGVLAYNAWFRRGRVAPLPDGARVVFFPGTIKSNSDVVRADAPWVQETLDGYLPVDDGSYEWQPRSRYAERRRRSRPSKRSLRGTCIKSWAPRP